MLGAFQVVLVVKNLPANAGDARDAGLTPESGRSPRGGNGTPLQYSCVNNPMDRRAWKATVHGVSKSWTQLSNSTKTTIGCVGNTNNKHRSHFQKFISGKVVLCIDIERAVGVNAFHM